MVAHLIQVSVVSYRGKHGATVLGVLTLTLITLTLYVTVLSTLIKLFPYLRNTRVCEPPKKCFIQTYWLLLEPKRCILRR